MEGIRQKGKKFYVRITVKDKNGVKKQREFAGGDTLEEAKKTKLRLEVKYMDEYYEKTKKLMFYELLDIYISETSFNLKESSKMQKLNVFKIIKKNFKNQNIYSIKRYDIQQTFNKLSTEYKKSTLKGIYGIINSSFEYAVNIMEILKENPCKKINIQGGESKTMRSYTREEYENIRDEFFKRKNKIYYYFFVFGIMTGMRKTEIIALKWDDIDFENKKINVKNGGYFKESKFYIDTPKTKYSIREVYINDYVVELLKEMKQKQEEIKMQFKDFYEENNFVFTYENGRNLGQGFTNTFILFVNRIVPINSPIHSMRHTHITWLIEAGANIKSIQHRVGHSDIKTTLNIYSHITEKMKKDTVKYLDEF